MRHVRIPASGLLTHADPPGMKEMTCHSATIHNSQTYTICARNNASIVRVLPENAKINRDLSNSDTSCTLV
jgi:hypothetical protein